MVSALVAGIMETLREPAIILGRQLRVVAASGPFYRLSGSDAAETLGQSLTTLHGGRWNDPKLVDLLAETTPDNTELTIVVGEDEQGGGELRYCLKARRLPREAGAHPLIFVSIETLGEGGTATAESRRQMQWAELDHAFRSRVVDQIIAALSHELAQPLSAITGFSHAALRTMRGLDPLPDNAGASVNRMIEAMEFVAAEAERAATIIRRARGFARRASPNQTLLDLNDLIREMTGFIAAEASSRRIEVATELAASLPPVRADRMEMAQVIVNLLRNGMDAIEAAKPAERRIVIRSRSNSQGAVEVAISDTGAGVPEDLADRVFMPFVSGQPEGLGLGLVICRTILQVQGGRLWTDDGEGGPTTFRFALPAVQVDSYGK